MKIIFLRHGESLGNTNHKFYKDDKTNFLSLKGVLQAQLAAHTIGDLFSNHDPFDATFVSDMTRSGQTACLVLQTIMDTRDHLIIDPRLNEWGFNATSQKDWFLSEPETEFFQRIESFYNDAIGPIIDTDVTYLITSHYYTMKGLFDIIAMNSGLIESYHPLDPYNANDIPNAIPYYWDSNTMAIPEMVTTNFTNH